MKTFSLHQGAGWFTKQYKSELSLSGNPTWFPVAGLIPDQRNTEFGLEAGRACFCNKLQSS